MKESLIRKLKAFSDGFAEHREDRHKRKVTFRKKAVYAVLLFFLTGEMAALFWNSGCVKGMNARADAYREAAVKEADAVTVSAGSVFDRNGVLLVENSFVKDANSGGIYEKCKYKDGKLYSNLIGFTTRKYVGYGEDIEGGVTEQQKDYRLMSYYRDWLYHTEKPDDTKGGSLVLTLNHNLQKKVEGFLETELENNKKGSAIVMNAKTGEILAMISFPEFDFNNLTEALEEMSETKDAYYPITHKGTVVPGSIFKVITAVAMIDAGMEDYTATDASFSIGARKVRNAYPDVGDQINLYQAIERSSNVYFANAVLDMGGNALQDTVNKFKIGQYLELDFGSVSSGFFLNAADKNELADTGYGQGKTLFSTIYGAMVIQTIANDGEMLKPYLVQKMLDSAGKTVKSTQPETLSQVTSKETADKVTNALRMAVQSHYRTMEEEIVQIYENYDIVGKTGTGENGDAAKTNSAWFISFAPADDPQYVVVINECNTTKFGSDLMDTAAKIYQCLF